MQTRDNVQGKFAKTPLPLFFKRLASPFSIKQVFTFSFMLQYVVVAALIAVLLIQGGQQAVKVILKEIRQEVLERVHEQIESHMAAPMQLNRLNVDAWKAGLLNLADPVSRERYFANHLAAFPDVAMAFVGTTDGAFYGARRKESGQIQIVRNNRDTGGDSWYYSISEQGDAIQRQEIFRNFDPRTRPWFESAKRVGGPTFSGVYRHFVFYEPTITAAYPVYAPDGSLIAVFGVDYLLSWLGDTLREMPVGVSGQIFITDAQGYLVATSVPGNLFEQKEGRFDRVRASDSANPVLQLASQAYLANGRDTVREFTYNDRPYLVDAKAFRQSGVDWNIYVVLASDDYLSGFKRAVDKTAVVTVLVVLLAFFIVRGTTNWVTRPILRLNDAARELAGGHLRAVPDTERQDELGQLSRSFNAMARQITDLVESLELKVEERTTALAEKTNEERRLREVLHTELEKAGREQKAMLPPDLNDEKVVLSIVYEPHMYVSGDFCGYQWMQEGDTLFGYLIDVTGHGVATALQAAAINVIIHETVNSGRPLADIAGEINRRVSGYLRDDTLVAACFFELDFRQKELRYIAAGITEFFSSASGRIRTPGILIGATELSEFEVLHMPVKAGDAICLYSDGIADKLSEGSQLPVNAGFGELLQEVRTIAASGARRDDATAVCIKIGRLY